MVIVLFLFLVQKNTTCCWYVKILSGYNFYFQLYLYFPTSILWRNTYSALNCKLFLVSKKLSPRKPRSDEKEVKVCGRPLTKRYGPFVGTALGKSNHSPKILCSNIIFGSRLSVEITFRQKLAFWMPMSVMGDKVSVVALKRFSQLLNLCIRILNYLRHSLN